MRRDRFVIMEDVLKICLDTASMKSGIMYRANLSFAQLELYLSTCVESGLLKKQIEGSRVVYVTTEKGREFLEAFDKVTSLIKAKKSMVKTDGS